jgi:hypothetical protein
MKTLLATLFGIILATTSAQATFHLWQITQLYSDPTGTVQFIELTNGNFDGQNLLMGNTITSNTNSYTFPNNLPFNTANHHFLIATPGYAAISGVPAPDYVLPSNNWFSLSSDTINYAGVNSLTFTPGQLPTDGVNSVNRAYNSTVLFVAENSPTNFAGAAGRVPPAPRALLGNISTRAFVQTGNNVMIGGFIVTGSGPIRVIVRAIGPSLVNHGITNPLQNPTLELHDHTGAVIAFNDNWMNAPNKQEIINSGLAPTNNLESAILMSLSPGNYTAIVRGVNNGTGIALVEAYDLNATAGSKLGNISTRALVQTGNNVMIGGFIITGAGQKRVIARAIGPSLARFGITNPLLDPTLELHDGNGAVIAFNDNWRDSQEAEIQATGLAPTDNRESAIVSTLAPGNYTAIVRGRNNTIGVALVEVYGLN